jgi:hypothetical protein
MPNLHRFLDRRIVYSGLTGLFDVTPQSRWTVGRYGCPDSYQHRGSEIHCMLSLLSSLFV